MQLCVQLFKKQHINSKLFSFSVNRLFSFLRLSNGWVPTFLQNIALTMNAFTMEFDISVLKYDRTSRKLTHRYNNYRFYIFSSQENILYCCSDIFIWIQCVIVSKMCIAKQHSGIRNSIWIFIETIIPFCMNSRISLCTICFVFVHFNKIIQSSFEIHNTPKCYQLFYHNV